LVIKLLSHCDLFVGQIDFIGNLGLK